MADFYWQGVHYQEWSEPTAWTTTNGGSTHPANAPTASDSVFFGTGGSGVACTCNSSVCLNLTISVTQTLTASTLTISGDLTVNAAISGTTSLILDGTGTWSGAGTMSNSLTINTAGTITISGIVYYKTGVFIYTAGTVTTTNSTLNLQGECDLDVKDITWNNITFAVANLYNIVDGLTLSNTLKCTASCSFDNMHLYGPPSNITITAGTTQSFAQFSINDTEPDAKCTIASSTPSSHFTFAKSSGLVHLRNCIISDSYASGNCTWYAGEQTCTDGGGNLKWIFHSPLMVNYNRLS